MACASCGSDKKVVARGLCRACYQRWWRRGTTSYAPKVEKVACSVGGCNDKTVANGMCDKHYRRWKKHGDTENAGPVDWGKRSKHPLYHSWKHLRQYRAIYPVCQEWLDDFWQFAFDLGEKPSKKHKLFRADNERPLGPDNFVWKESVTQKVDGEDEKTYQARAQRVYRSLKKESYDGYELKRNYGLSKSQLDKMLDEQDHKCAICGTEETAVIRGSKIRLSVDHCHTTGEIRGLLCTDCNRGIGLLKDNIELLQSAIRYLGCGDRK